MATERMIFTGHVQGVGFRYTVRSIAKGRQVTGYVRNLPDGSVELVAQGEFPEINAFASDVAERFRENISHCERRSDPNAAVYKVFDIRF